MKTWWWGRYCQILKNGDWKMSYGKVLPSHKMSIKDMVPYNEETDGLEAGLNQGYMSESEYQRGLEERNGTLSE